MNENDLKAVKALIEEDIDNCDNLDDVGFLLDCLDDVNDDLSKFKS